jgi:hypothetical protein
MREEVIGMLKQIKTLWRKIRVSVMFIWRHLFTLFFSIDIIADYLLATYNPIFWRVCVVLVAAAAFDWLKMKFKGKVGKDSYFKRDRNFGAVSNFTETRHWDESRPGTIAYYAARDMRNF